ncbi:MAG: hypothetical protein M1503_05820 [Thaumarchaeota archaeon]|nr:hypothetical protein [Nitrososphaerota archaeon]MCL5317763.1 hypothetical protein [Nitrososphaerota archaeon]
MGKRSNCTETALHVVDSSVGYGLRVERSHGLRKMKVCPAYGSLVKRVKASDMRYYYRCSNCERTFALGAYKSIMSEDLRG